MVFSIVQRRTSCGGLLHCTTYIGLPATEYLKTGDDVHLIFLLLFFFLLYQLPAGFLELQIVISRWTSFVKLCLSYTILLWFLSLYYSLMFTFF